MSKESVCENCKYRYSWDCDDGLAYPKNGCKDFELDFSTLSKKQQKSIRRVLISQTEQHRNVYWEDCA